MPPMPKHHLALHSDTHAFLNGSSNVSKLRVKNPSTSPQRPCRGAVRLSNSSATMRVLNMSVCS